MDAIIAPQGANIAGDLTAMYRNRPEQQVHGAVAVGAVWIVDQPPEAVGCQCEVVRRLSDVGCAWGEPVAVESHADGHLGRSPKYGREMAWLVPEPVQDDQHDGVQRGRQLAQYRPDVVEAVTASPAGRVQVVAAFDRLAPTARARDVRKYETDAAVAVTMKVGEELRRAASRRTPHSGPGFVR